MARDIAKKRFFSESLDNNPVALSHYQRLQFDSNYLAASALAEKGEALFLSLYERDKLLIAQPVIKRAVPGESDLYDLVSPFEYGSVYCSPETNQFDWQFFITRKRHYCLSQSIVSEFYRYSPGDTAIPENAIYADDHVYLDLQTDISDFMSDWNNSLRRAVKRSFRHEIMFRVSDSNSDIKTFIELYSALMKKREAKQFYFFSIEYFDKLLNGCKNSWLLLLETKIGEPVASSIIVGYGEFYYHLLTASDPDFLVSRPNERMIFELFRFCKEKGGEKLVLGGGAPSVKNFKLRFSKKTLPYFIDRQVYSEKLYVQLCNKRNVSVTSTFFPAYRI